MSQILAFLRSVLFYSVYILSVPLFGCLCLIIGPLLPLQRRFSFFMIWNHFIKYWLRLSCGIHLEVKGRELLPSGTYVVMANHQSPWETIFFFPLFKPVTAILKRELMWIPFFGWALSLLHPVPIQRSNARKARQQLLSKGQKLLNEKAVSILIFPEGTRVQPGEQKKFSAGGAELAITAGVPIVPVAHNAGYFWPARRFTKYPVTIRVNIGPPINSEGKTPKSLALEAESWIRQHMPGRD